MAKKDLSGKWRSRFERVAMNATNPEEWHYSRLSLESAVTAFNELGLLGYQIVAEEAVYREDMGKYVKKCKAPGIYFRIVRM